METQALNIVFCEILFFQNNGQSKDALPVFLVIQPKVMEYREICFKEYIKVYFACYISVAVSGCVGGFVLILSLCD